MWFFIKDFFSKCDQIHRKLQIWTHLLKKWLMENFIFCAVIVFYFYFFTNRSKSKDSHKFPRCSESKSSCYLSRMNSITAEFLVFLISNFRLTRESAMSLSWKTLTLECYQIEEITFFPFFCRQINFKHPLIVHSWKWYNEAI